METDPMIETGPTASATPSPADEIRMLVELLRPMGASLTRRWVAALLLAPPEDRERIVESVSARLVSLYPLDDGTRSAERPTIASARPAERSAVA